MAKNWMSTWRVRGVGREALTMSIDAALSFYIVVGSTWGMSSLSRMSHTYLTALAQRTEATSSASVELMLVEVWTLER